MEVKKLLSLLEQDPVIAAISNDKWEEALQFPGKVIFYLSADLLTLDERVKQAHAAGKFLMVHMDLAEGIGKDKTGVSYLTKCGVDGIITTKSNLIRYAKEQGLVAIQRCFALDSRGLESIAEALRNTSPHLMEIMPGVIPKVITRFAKSSIPVIAGGLLQTKTEVMEALRAGATAVSTGSKELWYL